jgi:O-methyltransferase involved in polyketide biosynthesis
LGPPVGHRKIETIWRTVQKKVSRWEEWLVCLRNRYFADCLEAFEKRHETFTFLNIAAGFTTYPYLISDKRTVVEIDYPHVIAYKREKLAFFEKNGDVPRRTIQFIALDLNQKEALRTIKEIIQKSAPPFFVLLEGLLYYLKPESVKNIFTLLNVELPAESQVGVISWASQIKKSGVMVAVQDYFANELGFPKQEYTWIDDEWFDRWGKLKVVERTNYIELDRRYCQPPNNFQREEIIDESFHLLQRV